MYIFDFLLKPLILLSYSLFILSPYSRRLNHPFKTTFLPLLALSIYSLHID